MKKLEWYFSNFGFCNGISLISESCNGIDPINPNIKEKDRMSRIWFFFDITEYELKRVVSIKPRHFRSNFGKPQVYV
jgi:hypothetical protein